MSRPAATVAVSENFRPVDTKMVGMPTTAHRSLDPFDALVSGRARQTNASAIREILKITEDEHVISFAGGLPAPELFPLEEVREATDRVLRDRGAAALQYSTTEGHRPLREWIARRDGIPTDNVQIVTGSQQGLDLLARVLIDEGDVVLVETPTYLGALQAFTFLGPRYVQLPTDDHGIDVDALERILADHPAKLLYTVPNFQNPTGRTMSLERRRRLIEVSARHGVIVIEDDPYGEIRFSGEALPSLYSLALAEAGGDPDRCNVVYSGSFSKTLAPGLRDGWLQAPAAIMRKVVEVKQAADLHTPTLNQLIITELVDEVLPRQVERVRALYGQRATHMMDAIERLLPADVRHTTPEGGMFLWLTLPGHIDTTAMLPDAVARHVAYVPGPPFFALGGGTQTMRLSFSSADFAQIDEGMAALGETIRVWEGSARP
mgnify:CR=1 FL=1